MYFQSGDSVIIKASESWPSLAVVSIYTERGCVTWRFMHIMGRFDEQGWYYSLSWEMLSTYPYLQWTIKAIGDILVWVSGSIFLLKLVLKNYGCCFFSFSQVLCGLIHIKKDLYLGPPFIKFVLKQKQSTSVNTLDCEGKAEGQGKVKVNKIKSWWIKYLLTILMQIR